MKFIDIHTHRNSVADFSLTNCYPNSTNFNFPFSIGIHPWYINTNKTKENLEIVEKLLQHDNCFALGECGLDKLIETDFDTQLSVFKQQISLSEKHKKPLIIHCVKSFQEILHLKRELKPQQPWLIHGFNKNIQVATSLIKNGVFLSFGEQLLTSKKLEEVYRELPLESIFLETDDSKTNISHIYKKAASIKNIETQQLKEIIHQNFNRIFTK